MQYACVTILWTINSQLLAHMEVWFAFINTDFSEWTLMEDNSTETTENNRDDNDEVKTEEPVAVSKEEAWIALKNELPDYIVDSFMTAGYDILPVISKMDTSKTAGNSLEEVEQYISTELIDDPRFCRGITNHDTFKFLPGHQQRITDFVNKIT